MVAILSINLKKQCKHKKANNVSLSSENRKKVPSFKFDIAVCKLADAFTATLYFHGLLFLSCALMGTLAYMCSKPDLDIQLAGQINKTKRSVKGFVLFWDFLLIVSIEDNLAL